jgi:hypothetical protein
VHRLERAQEERVQARLQERKTEKGDKRKNKLITSSQCQALHHHSNLQLPQPFASHPYGLLFVPAKR